MGIALGIEVEILAERSGGLCRQAAKSGHEAK
jgi:hypothetical protein